MRSIFIAGMILAVFVSTSCQRHDEIIPSTLPTPIRLNVTPTGEPTQPQAIIQLSATQPSSPLPEPTASALTATPRLAVYRGKSFYSHTLLFEFTYDEAIWQVVQIVGDDEFHERSLLILRDEPTCYVIFPAGATEYRNIGPLRLGERPWMLRLFLPDYLIYDTEIDGHPYIAGLHLPEDYRQGQHSDCQKLAESVLVTIRIVNEPVTPSPSDQPAAIQPLSPLPQAAPSAPAATPRLAVYRGKGAYSKFPRFEMTYDEAIWQIVGDENNPENLLFVREEPTCYLALREMPRWRTAFTLLAEDPWILRLYPSNYLTYEIEIDGHAYIFGLHLPEAYREGQPSNCQNLAESVLATVRKVDEN